MSDYTELKRLAEAALRNWPDSKLFERPECERFIDASRPDVVLALIAEVDGLHAQHGRDSGELRKICAARDSARRQRDQLKAENEALRRAGTDALRFVAFAFDEGVEGAEQAGRAIENAIGAKS